MIRTSFLVLASLVLFSTSIASATPLLHYTFDEPSGDALDTGSAPNTPGQLMGGATRSSDTPGGFGSSIDLRNDSPSFAHVLEGDAADLDGLAALTLTTWLKVESYPGGNNRLVAKQAPNPFGGFSWNMNASPNTGVVGPDNFRLALFLGNNVSSGPADFTFGFSSEDVDADNKWVFLAVTYDSTQAANNTKFYIGSPAAGVSQLGADQTLGQITVEGGTSRFGVGFTDAAPGADTSVKGWQDDVRVYGSALSLADLERVRLANAIPEPGSLALLCTAALALGLRRRI